MKKLEMEKMARIEGGWDLFGAVCGAGFLAIVGFEGLGSPERYILATIYDSSTGCSVSY